MALPTRPYPGTRSAQLHQQQEQPQPRPKGMVYQHPVCLTHHMDTLLQAASAACCCLSHPVSS